MSTAPGYFTVPLSVWAHPALAGAPTKRDIVMAISGFAYGDRETCWPSNRTIAELVGRSVGHVRRLIGDLVRQAPELLDRQPTDGNLTGRVFRLAWKAPLPAPPPATDNRSRAGGARQRSEPCAPTTTAPCAPARSEFSNEEKKEMNAVGVECPEGHTPPAEPEPPPTPENLRAALAEGIAAAKVTAPPAAPKPPAPPLLHGKTLADVAADQARQIAALAEMQAHKARQAAAVASPAADPAEPTEATSGVAGPRGWVGRLLGRLRE